MSFPEEKWRSGKDLNVSHRHIWVKRKLVPPCVIPLPFAVDDGSLEAVEDALTILLGVEFS